MSLAARLLIKGAEDHPPAFLGQQPDALHGQEILVSADRKERISRRILQKPEPLGQCKPNVPLGYSDQDVPLGSEVVVDRGGRDRGAFGNLGDACRLIAALGKQRDGRIENLLAAQTLMPFPKPCHSRAPVPA